MDCQKIINKMTLRRYERLPPAAADNTDVSEARYGNCIEGNHEDEGGTARLFHIVAPTAHRSYEIGLSRLLTITLIS